MRYVVALVLVLVPCRSSTAEPTVIDFRETPDFGGDSLTYALDGIIVRHIGGAVTAEGIDLRRDRVSFIGEDLELLELDFSLRSGGFLRFSALDASGSFNNSDFLIDVREGDTIRLPVFEHGFDVFGEGAVLHSIELVTDLPALFFRGAVNADEKVDMSDAVFLLTHLFLGGVAPSCLDAADSNDDGTLDLSDSIGLLQHLFLGGFPPRAPFESCGLDPTEDPLGCVSFPPCAL